MTTGLSIHDLLAGLPVATIVYDNEGLIVATSNAFLQLIRSSTKHSLGDLGQLGAVLQRITISDHLLEGQCAYKGPEGALRITWRQITTNTSKAIIACLITDAAPSSLTTGAGATEPTGTTSHNLPDPQATHGLLAKALALSKQEGRPLSVVQIGFYTHDNLRLVQADYEAWRSLGRKVRSVCRMSDLVGVNNQGDFLIILMGIDHQDTQKAINRVLGQLESWSSSNLTYTTLAKADYNTWSPNAGVTTEEFLALF